MKEQLEAYVNGLFADAALTIRNAEVRQEILQHALDRYDDLIASGKTEQHTTKRSAASETSPACLSINRQKLHRKSGTSLPRPRYLKHSPRQTHRRRKSGSPAGPSPSSVWARRCLCWLC